MVLAFVISAICLVAYLALSRAGEYFCVSVRDGQALRIRGRVPPSLMSDFREVVKEAEIRRGTIRAHTTPDGLRLSTTGIDEGRTQRLRNILGLYPVARLRSAPPATSQNVGQWLGIAWLAWLATRR